MRAKRLISHTILSAVAIGTIETRVATPLITSLCQGFVAVAIAFMAGLGWVLADAARTNRLIKIIRAGRGVRVGQRGDCD